MQVHQLLAVVASLLAYTVATPTPHTFKICVPQKAYDACLQMVEQGKTVGVSMTCVAARDRMDCMTRMKQHTADWEAVDPEDMYIASKRFGDIFSIVKEIRTKEEPDAEFRYEAVVVVHKDQDIKSIEDLKGLTSCHTGVGRNVGYKIPITKLTKMGILPPLNDTKLSPRENELKSLSTFFSKSCIVGKWSPNPEINQRLKKQYSNLCQLCEFPGKCDYPDQNSGYEGALRCLAVGGGNVAFTKVIFVKKFFGMAYGSQPAAKSDYKPEDYSYLCPDASKRPVTGEPCVWAARPWPGYMTADTEEADVTELREDIAKLNALGESTHAAWISSVLALNDKTLARDNKGPYTPHEYLEKAKYEDVIERDVLEPRRFVKICTTSPLEQSKCEDLAAAAYSRDIRPSISCVAKTGIEECLNSVNDSETDLVSADPAIVLVTGIGGFSVVPLLIEEYENDHSTTQVAVVKKTSTYQTVADLVGKTACSAPMQEVQGWILPSPWRSLVTTASPVKADKTRCGREWNKIFEVFSETKYSDEPIKCLSTGEGIVAFTNYESALNQLAALEAAGQAKSADFELFCENGGRKPIDQYATCNLGKIFPRSLLSRLSLSPLERDDFLFTMLSAADLFHKHSEYFDMFGSYNGQRNVLFSNSASGLVGLPDFNSVTSDFAKLKSARKGCN